MSDKTVRAGSKNWRYNFQDETIKANGFQIKSATSFTSVGDVEYRFRDVETGEAKTEHLSVGNDGVLYKKKFHYVKFSSLGTATSYSYYYDEVSDTFLLKFNSYAAITITDVLTMDQLKTAINALGMTCTIVDDDDVSVTSTKLAQYMDVVINKALVIGQVDEMNSQYFEAVDYPASQFTSSTRFPFPISKDYSTSDNYEGISYVNLNNSVYITDGGFPMKYDGRQVVRMGMPRVLKPIVLLSSNLSGMTATSVKVSQGGMTATEVYKYIFQIGYVDYNGVEVIGTQELIDSCSLKQTVGTGKNAIQLFYSGIFENNFAINSCVAYGSQDLSDAGGTIDVYSSSNIKTGMILRIPISNAVVGYSGYSIIQSKVSSAYSGIQISANTTNGSAIVTMSSTSGIGVNAKVSGTGVPANTRVLTVDSSTQVTLTANATVTATNTLDFAGLVTLEKGYTGVAGQYNYPFQPALVQQNGSRTSGSAIVTGLTTSILDVGMFVIGTGIPANTTILSIDSASQITMTANATTTSSSTLDFIKYKNLIVDNQVLNGGYANSLFENQITTVNSDNPYLPTINFGAFLRVFRTTKNTNSFYKLIDLPIEKSLQTSFVDDFSDTYLSSESILDAELGSELPRACKYLTKWQDRIVQSGRPVNPSVKDTAYPTSIDGTAVINEWSSNDTSYFGYLYSEAGICDFQSIYWNESPEGFPQDGLHEFLIESQFDDQMTGVAPNKDALFAFKERSTGVLTGDLGTNQIQLELLEDDIGCVSHRSIQEVRGSLVWLDGVNGFYSCVAGRLPENIGFPISDYQKINALGLNYKTAISTNFRKESLYVCAVGSTTFVFDYAADGSLQRNCWYLWDRFNAKSLLTINDELYLNTGSTLYKMKLTNTKYDFTDHKSAIDFVLNTAWLNMQAPTVDKKFIRTWINSIQGGFSLDISEYGNYLDNLISTYSNQNFIIESSTKTAVKIGIDCARPKLSALSIGLRNNNKNEYVRIQGIEIQYSVDYDLGEPKQ